MESNEEKFAEEFSTLLNKYNVSLEEAAKFLERKITETKLRCNFIYQKNCKDHKAGDQCKMAADKDGVHCAKHVRALTQPNYVVMGLDTAESSSYIHGVGLVGWRLQKRPNGVKEQTIRLIRGSEKAFNIAMEQGIFANSQSSLQAWAANKNYAPLLGNTPTIKNK
jgi:hypothetical protein